MRRSKPDICAKGFELFVRQAREAQINSDYPKFDLGIFKKAMAAGYGEEAFGALSRRCARADGDSLLNLTQHLAPRMN
jgi:hypothetical protein